MFALRGFAPSRCASTPSSRMSVVVFVEHDCRRRRRRNDVVIVSSSSARVASAEKEDPPGWIVLYHITSHYIIHPKRTRRACAWARACLARTFLIVCALLRSAVVSRVVCVSMCVLYCLLRSFPLLCFVLCCLRGFDCVAASFVCVLLLVVVCFVFILV